MKLFSKYTVIFAVVISLYALGDYWTKDLAYSQIPNENLVTIAKPGIVKYDWTSGNLDYKGVNGNSDAADADTDWTIYKYTWVADNPTQIQERQGSWTGRALLF